MTRFRVQVLDGRLTIKAWPLFARGLEEAKNEAERAVALDWPMKEFTVEPWIGGTR